jgi:hypothetical protein
MSFKIEPKETPSPVEGIMQARMSPRERAIAKLMDQQKAAAPAPQSNPVPNPSSVSPEEMGALSVSQPKDPVKDLVQGQNNPSESPTEPKEVIAGKEEQPLSSRYADLARKERAIRAKAQEIKQREEALARQEAERQTQAPKPGQPDLAERLKADPMSVLNELGISYDKLTEQALSLPSPEQQVIQELKAEIKRLSDAQEGTKKSFEEAQSNQYKQAVNQIRNEAKTLIESDEAFETIKSTESVEDVVELITKTFETEGVLLSVEEAAKAVEEHLVEEALKLARLKKIQQRLAPTPSAPKQEEPTKQPQAAQVKTLSNTMGASRPLTAKERAILAFKNELKSG